MLHRQACALHVITSSTVQIQVSSGTSFVHRQTREPLLRSSGEACGLRRGYLASSRASGLHVVQILSDYSPSDGRLDGGLLPSLTEAQRIHSVACADHGVDSINWHAERSEGLFCVEGRAQDCTAEILDVLESESDGARKLGIVGHILGRLREQW